MIRPFLIFCVLGKAKAGFTFVRIIEDQNLRRIISISDIHRWNCSRLRSVSALPVQNKSQSEVQVIMQAKLDNIDVTSMCTGEWTFTAEADGHTALVAKSTVRKAQKEEVVAHGRWKVRNEDVPLRYQEWEAYGRSAPTAFRRGRCLSAFFTPCVIAANTGDVD